MSTEGSDTSTMDEVMADAAPPPLVHPPNGKKLRKLRLEAAEDEDKGSVGHAGTSADATGTEIERVRSTKGARDPLIANIKRDEDLSIKDFLAQLGTDVPFRIALHRKEPEEMRVNNKVIRCGGHLKTYETAIDEDTIARHHGGGTYNLRVQRRHQNGSFVYFTQRTVKIAGDPNLDDPCLPQVVDTKPAAAPAAAPSGEPTMVKEVFGMLSRELDRARDKPTPGVDPTMQMMLTQLQDLIRAKDTQIDRLSQQITDLRNTPAPKDEIKDKLLGSLLDGESGRITSIRVAHESEINALKTSHREDEKRLMDRYDRMMSEQRQTFERMLADQKASFEREISHLKLSTEAMGVASKAAHDVALQVLKGDNHRLEKDNDNLRDEVKELRAKKEKGLIEMATEVEKVKELLGLDDGGEKSGLDKVMEMASTPAAVELVQRITGGGKQAETPQQAAQRPQVAAGPQIVAAANGQRFYSHPPSKEFPKGRLVPVKKRPPPPEVVVHEDGTATALPVIDQATLNMAISFLEQAYATGKDPVIVAQTYRTTIPADIMRAISDHGIDTFMSKIAKLPPTSPLTNQNGKNWIRKIGKALVGDESE